MFIFYVDLQVERYNIKYTKANNYFSDHLPQNNFYRTECGPNSEGLDYDKD